MLEKVKVSSIVAEEIIVAKSRFQNPYDAVRYLSRDKDFKLTEEDAVKAVNGYLNDYEIEQTPEEKLSTYFHKVINHSNNNSNNNYVLGLAHGIRLTLDELGIKIKGINE